MLDSFLRHVTKDSYGPIPYSSSVSSSAVVHKFHDGFSILGWGKMPELIYDRGRIGSQVYTRFNQEVASKELWTQFLKSSEALSFRKSGSSIAQSGNVSTMLNELVESLPIRTTMLGVIGEQAFKDLTPSTSFSESSFLADAIAFSKENKKTIYPVCEFIAEERPPVAAVMGRAVWDYSLWKKQMAPKVLPFDFISHFTLNERSLKKLRIDALSLPKTASLHTLQAGVTWDFPVMELVLPHDPFQRRIDLSQAMMMTGFSPEELQKTLLSCAWVSAFVKARIKNANLHSLKIRFALDHQGKLFVCDSFALDDFVLEKDGVLFHSDKACDFYQKTSWYESVLHAQKHAETFGLPEWKRLCVEPVPMMDPKFKQELEELHQTFGNALVG